MYSCPYCSKKYKMLYTLKGHVKEKHSKVCPICGFSGKMISHLNHRDDLEHLEYKFLVFHKRTSDACIISEKREDIIVRLRA